MKPPFRIIPSMKAEILDEELRRHYNYPLINFAYVFADVIADDTVFSKTVGGRRISEVAREKKALTNLRKDIVRILKSYSSGFLPDEIKRILQKNELILEKLIIMQFDAFPFIKNIDARIAALDRILNIYQKKPEDSFFPWPIKTSTRQFNPANQISFLCAQSIRGNNGIHWVNICDLITWFARRLRTAKYKTKLHFGREDEDEISGYPKVLKNQYVRIKNDYLLILFLSAELLYFPHVSKRPLFHTIETIDLDNPSKGFPILTIEFYKDRVRTVYKEPNNLKLRETIFKKKESLIEIKNLDEGEKEPGKLLLQIE